MGLFEHARAIARQQDLSATLLGTSDPSNPFDALIARVELELAQIEPLIKKGRCLCGKPATLSASKGKQPGSDYCEGCWTLDVLPLVGGEG